jgi:hypothetical protein
LLFTNFGEERFSDEAHYRCVYDKVGEAGGIIEFEVPEKSS